MDYEKVVKHVRNMVNSHKYDVDSIFQVIRGLIDATSLENQKEAEFRDHLRSIIRTKIQSVEVPVVSAGLPVKKKAAAKADKGSDRTCTTRDSLVGVMETPLSSYKYTISVFYRSKWLTDFFFDYTSGSPFRNRSAVVLVKKIGGCKKIVYIPYCRIKVEANAGHDLLSRMAAFVREYHRGVFELLSKQFPKYALKMDGAAYRIGKATPNKRGQCDRRVVIQINRFRRVDVVRMDMSPRKAMESVFHTLYHEMLHVFYNDHKGHFIHYESLFDNTIYDSPTFSEFVQSADVFMQN